MQAKKKQLLVILGSPRNNGNSELIARQIAEGFSVSGHPVIYLKAEDQNIKPCTGCLKCNKTGRCETHRDGWEAFLDQFKNASHIVIASPIYFHHFPGTLKILFDRFRSQLQIRMTAEGLIHQPRWVQRKKYAFVFALGDRHDHDTRAPRSILTFLVKLLGARDEDIHTLIGYGLAIRRQVILAPERLKNLYQKLGLPPELAQKDYRANQNLLKQAWELGHLWADE